MNTKQLLIALGVLVVIALIIGVGSSFMSKNPTTSMSPSPSVTGVACTMDAMMCPDGSYVGRQGPNCEFAMCPSGTASTTSFSLKIGQKGGALGVAVTPIEVLEDSRCPVNVQCIQAGTVRLNADVTVGTTTSRKMLTLNNATTTGAYKLTLTGVTPVRTANVTPTKADYTFSFTVTK